MTQDKITLHPNPSEHGDTVANITLNGKEFRIELRTDNEPDCK